MRLSTWTRNFSRQITKTSLRFECLEDRYLLSAVRLVSWNALNGPNDGSSDANFSTILSAIGNETVQGNTRPVDILALQETDVPGAGDDSIGRIESILDTLYPGTDYASAVSTVDGGGDHTGFVYDTSTVSLMETVEIDPGVHNILRGLFRPTGTAGESDFYVYTVHLVSSGGAAARAVEAQILRNDADALGEGANILMVGDFNMEGSSEGAWTNLLAAGAGQLQDVGDAPGEWSEDASFRSVHTQDPMGNMDDRFDIHFASGEFYDGVGIDYIDGSYHVFGNNGTHTLGGSITTGSGASPAVLSALAAASDHLPVVADYDVITSTPNVRIRETGDSTKVIEGGDFDIYTVVLDTVPSANVTVTISPDLQLDTGGGAGISTQLVFTPGNALTPQTVIVSAANDAANEMDHTGFITHSSSSSDLDYDALAIDSVTADIVDDDDPKILINEIDSDTAGVDMLEFVELYDGGVGNSSLDGKTLVFFDGSDDEASRVISLTGFSTDANGFFVAGNSGVASADVTFPNGGLGNGADAVALYDGSFSVNDPVTTTNLLDAIVYDTDDADDAGLLVLLEASQPQVNENENGDSDIESLSRVPDLGNARETDTYVAQTPTPDALNSPPPAGVTIFQSASRVDVSEDGQTDSYQIALDTFPTNDVMITVDPDDQTDLGAGAGVAIVLTFTSANGIVPQTVNVTAVDDMDAEGDHTSIITHTASSIDSNYNSIVIGNIVANVVDNEVIIPAELVISEIMYNPDTAETGDSPEWIEVANIGGSTADLAGWFFDDEDGGSWGSFPSGTLLAPGQTAVFFDIDITESVFRSEWSVPTNALVVGISWAGLANSPSPTDEILELIDNEGSPVDLVNYDDANGWPSDSPDGPSIYLSDLTTDNNVGTNWARSQVGVDAAINPSGPTFSTTDVGSPGLLPQSADFDFSGTVDGLDFLAWQIGFGTAAPAALKVDGDADSDLDVDSADLAFWETDYGTISGVAALSAAISTPPPQPVTSAVSGALLPSIGNDVLLALPMAAEAETTEPAADSNPSTSVSLSATDEALAANLTSASPLDEEISLILESDEVEDENSDNVFAEWDELALVVS